MLGVLKKSRLLVIWAAVGLCAAWPSAAWAQKCLNVELRANMKKAEQVLESAKEVAQLPALKQAYDELSDLKTRAESMGDFCRQTLPAQRTRLLTNLRNRIAQLESMASAVQLTFSTSFEGDAVEQDLRGIRLNGELVNTGGKHSTGGAAHTLVLEFDPPRTRDLVFDLRVDNASIPDIRAERTEGSRTYQLPSLEPGLHNVSLVVTGKLRPKRRYLSVNFIEGSTPEGLSLTIDDVNYDQFDKRILLPSEGEKLDVKITHPPRETNDGWFRLGAKVGTQKLKPADTERTNTVYTVPLAPSTTVLRLQPVQGPKESKAREPVMWVGLAVAALGGGWALYNGLEHMAEDEAGWELFEDRGCDEDTLPETCDKDAWEEIDEHFDNSESALTHVYIGLGAMGVGLVVATIGYLLEEGREPPSDLARAGSLRLARHGESEPAWARVRVVPQLNATSLGAQVVGTW